jgi:peptidoglycan-N-acetylglucosamine deacetylase
LPSYITSSWDDGDPRDLRVAELLNKYGVPGTFYIPRATGRRIVTSSEIRELSAGFEIGAHTLKHNKLTGMTDRQAMREMVGSKAWLEDSLGQPCSMFCPPLGRYTKRHLRLAARIGFVGLRSTELISINWPRVSYGIAEMPTSMQAFPHGPLAICRNAVRRRTPINFWRYVTGGGSRDWSKLAESLLTRVLLEGGVFHLWGHSWELQQTGQWALLEHVLAMMRNADASVKRATNGQICWQSMQQYAINCDAAT